MKNWPEICSNVSKLDGKVGAGIHSTCLAISLPDYCSVFQVEKCAIHEAINCFKTGLDVCVLSDSSQAALRALDSPRITSRSVPTVRISLEEITTQMNTCLCRNIPGNCKADELAGGSTLCLHNDFGILMGTL